MINENEVIEVWKKMWGTRKDLKTEIDAGAVYLSVSRLEKDMTALFKKAFERGQLQGRADMRRDIESGAIPPVERRKDD